MNARAGLDVCKEQSAEALSAASKKDQTIQDIKFLWQSEDLGTANETEELKEEEDDLHKALIENYKKTTYRDKSGRYVIRLQFKDNILALRDNRDITISRLHSFLSKLSKDPDKLKGVDDEVQKYLNEGFIEPARPRRADQFAHYLPVQAIFKASPEGPFKKVRVVKDASCRKPNEPSLNDCLHAGPSLLPNLVNVILKFRQYKYALTADIRKAFNQFLIAEEDRSVLRFAWPLGISENPRAPVREFWTTRLDFGLASAPFLHCLGIQLHLENAARQFPNQAEFLGEIKRHFFMDDICLGSDSIEEAKERIKLLFTVFESAHFPLAKWASNNEELGRFVQDTTPVSDSTISFNEPNGKFLGIPWNLCTDTLSVPTENALKKLHSSQPTKRLLLSTVACIFDPIGILSPTTINAKVLLQSLWRSSHSWDKPLEEEHSRCFTEFGNLLQRTANTGLPRHLRSPGKVVERQLCCFSDASVTAYAAVCYIREVFENEPSRVYFVMAKAKPAPIRQISIARLELLGSLLGARVLNSVKSGLDFEIHACYMFTDNSSVLAWANSDPEKWKAFIANRIRRIRALVGQAPFGFVRSKSNPADIPSRSLDISEAATRDLWLNGPSWLASSNRIPEESSPLKNTADGMTLLEAEKKPSLSPCFINMTAADPTGEIPFESRCSTWLGAIRFWACIRRLKAKMITRRPGRESLETHLTANRSTQLRVSPEEMIESRLDLIRIIQSTYFKEEHRSKCSRVKPSSTLYQYNPFTDEQGIIRCRSRLERSTDLSENQKFPILLPSTSRFSKLIIRDIHARRNLHSGGVAATLHVLRQDFLIIHARKLVSQVAAACALCKIFHAKAASLPVAPLPRFRVERSNPFEFAACDFCGPMKYKDSCGNVGKAYLLVFVCAVTRAINIHATTDLSTWEVLGALQKFVSRNPAVKTIISDNGASFHRAAKELKTIYEHIRCDVVKKWLANKFIVWKFMTPTAAAHAGFYERLIQCTKRPLRKILGSAVPHFRDLEVIVANIEAMVNSRPITVVTAGANETEALSPANLLYGYKGNTIFPQHGFNPLRKEDQESIVFSKRWRYQQRLLNAFWRRFQEEYLCYLKTAHKHPDNKLNPVEVGDICLLEDKSSNRGLWPLCRVIALPENKSPSQARSCTIKTATGKLLNRPIYKLYPIQKSD